MMDFQQPPSYPTPDRSSLSRSGTPSCGVVWARADTTTSSFGKHLALAVSLGISDSQIRQARDNLASYYERLDKLYARVVTTGKGLFIEANHCRVDAIVLLSGPHRCLGDYNSKEQDDSATTRARENIQRSITILHDIYDTVMDDKKSLREFEYLYGGGYGAFPVITTINWADKVQVQGVKELVQRWSSGEFEIECESLLEEVEGRWQTAEEQRAVIVHRKLSSGIDRGPETVCESAEREITSATALVVQNRRQMRSEDD